MWDDEYGRTSDALVAELGKRVFIWILFENQPENKAVFWQTWARRFKGWPKIHT